MSSTNPTPAAPSARLTSLDQFRGYTMFGMLLVNFLGAYKVVCPYVLQHHHDYCSYADTIMPQFLFAAGFAMRLSLGKRFEVTGNIPWGRAVRRILGLALVAILWYGFVGLSGIIHRFQTQPATTVLFHLFKRELLQTLLHIAITSLWILPVITSSWQIRVGYAIASGLLHILLSWWFNFDWVYTPPVGIDGGPLGFLTWAIPALCGTLASDVVKSMGTRAVPRLAAWGIAVMLLGWGISNGSVLYNVRQDDIAEQTVVAIAEPPGPVSQMYRRPSTLNPSIFASDPVIPSMERIRSWDGSLIEPPFVPPPGPQQRRWNYWMMSQRGGTLSYPTFAAGFSLFVFAFFLWICDSCQFRLGFFRTLGTNSLAAYMFHYVAGWILDATTVFSKAGVPLFPETTPSITVALTGFLCFTLLVYGGCRFLESRGWYLRV